MSEKIKETRVLVLSPELLRQFDLVVPCGPSTALTFWYPLDAFELLNPEDVDSDMTVESPQQRKERLWGRMELCLAFTDATTKWQ